MGDGLKYHKTPGNIGVLLCLLNNATRKHAKYKHVGMKRKAKRYKGAKESAARQIQEAYLKLYDLAVSQDARLSGLEEQAKAASQRSMGL